MNPNPSTPDHPLLAAYAFGPVLGKGGQGVTWAATERATGRGVAVKSFALATADGWKDAELFEREAGVLATLDHSGIPQWIETITDPDSGDAWLIMARCPGEPLSKWLDGARATTEAELWAITHQVLDLLAYLHGHMPPVIHRDIKPGNLVRAETGEVALVDFGGVCLAARPDGGSTVVGTFGYLAPEQLHGEATPATDLYSLGATLVALATSTRADRLPRKGLKIDLRKVMDEGPMRKLLSALLEPDPDRRPSNVAAVRALLPSVMADSRAATDPRAAPAPMSPLPAAAFDRSNDFGADGGWALIDGLPFPLNRLVALAFFVAGTFGRFGLFVADRWIVEAVFRSQLRRNLNRPARLEALLVQRRAIKRTLRDAKRSLEVSQSQRKRLGGPPKRKRRSIPLAPTAPRPPRVRGKGRRKRGRHRR